MKIYVMRHALTDEGERMDATRGINDVGREQCRVMRKFLKAADVNPDVIISSKFARTRETAEVVQRGNTPIKTTAALDPDSTVDKAWKAVLNLAGESKSVLVVMHGPLIQPFLASVAFCFREHWEWPHAGIAYVNTDASHFRWFVTPKLAAHIVGVDASDVAEELAREAYGRACVALSENLTVAHKAAVVDPLVSKMRSALRGRWRRQLKRLLAILDDLRPAIRANDVAHVTNMLDAALPANDPKFAKIYNKVRDAAYAHGATHVNVQLGMITEAAPKRPLQLPATYQPEGDVSLYEDGLDETTSERVKTSIAGVGPLTLLAVAAALRTTLNGFSQVEAGQVSRGETAALNVVSDAYHQGGADVASFVADSTGGEVEKHWDAEDDACEICIENEDEGWIPEDAPHSSGDFEPQAHPNCRCSESYRVATAE
jgi:phosphohistidine phosphatase SixA